MLYVCLTTHVWLAVEPIVTHEHRRQDGSRRLGTVLSRNRQGPTNKRRNLEVGALYGVVPVASVADGAPALCGLNVEYQ